MQKRKAFTLVEILVVIAIIMILAALTLSVIGRAKGASTRAACLSNVRQIGTAMLLYDDDWNAFPPQTMEKVGTRITKTSTMFLDSIHPYLGGTLVRCPEEPKKDVPAKFNSGYCMNARLNIVSPSGFFEGRTSVESPSLTVMALDCRTSMIGLNSPDGTPGALDTAALDIAREWVGEPDGGTRHAGGANYAFVDDHAKWLRPAQPSFLP